MKILNILTVDKVMKCNYSDHYLLKHDTLILTSSIRGIHSRMSLYHDEHFVHMMEYALNRVIVTDLTINELKDENIIN